MRGEGVSLTLQGRTHNKGVIPFSRSLSTCSRFAFEQPKGISVKSANCSGFFGKRGGAVPDLVSAWVLT